MVFLPMLQAQMAEQIAAAQHEAQRLQSQLQELQAAANASAQAAAAAEAAQQQMQVPCLMMPPQCSLHTLHTLRIVSWHKTDPQVPLPGGHAG